MKREDSLTQGELENRVLRALPAQNHPPIQLQEVAQRAKLLPSTAQDVLRRLGYQDQIEVIHNKGYRRTVERPQKIRSRQAQALEMAEAFIEDLPFIEREESNIYVNGGQALILTGGEEGVREGRVTIVYFDGTVMEAPVGTWTTLRYRGERVG